MIWFIKVTEIDILGKSKKVPKLKIKNQVYSNHIYGSSPPSVFIGRIGYPHVYAGPLVPPVLGNTSLYDSPEHWLGKTFEEIINFRTNLIRGKFKIHVKKPLKNKSFLNKTLEVALSKDPIESEITFKKILLYWLVWFYH